MKSLSIFQLMDSNQQISQHQIKWHSTGLSMVQIQNLQLEIEEVPSEDQNDLQEFHAVN